MAELIALDALKLGASAGIIGGITAFWTALNGAYGKSKAYKVLESSTWGSYGYTNSWKGAFIGLILGFIYAGVMVGITALIYNWIL